MSQKTAFYVLSLIVIFFIGYYYAKINLEPSETSIDVTNTSLGENKLKEELSEVIKNKNDLQTQLDGLDSQLIMTRAELKTVQQQLILSSSKSKVFEDELNQIDDARKVVKLIQEELTTANNDLINMAKELQQVKNELQLVEEKLKSSEVELELSEFELQLAEEKLDPTPTKEYDSVLIDQKLEEESSKDVVESVADETAENEKVEAAPALQNFESPLPKLSINDKIQFRVATINFYSGSSQVDGSGLNKIKRVAKIAKEREAKIKIVGHASKRTRDMPLAKHKLVNFNISDKRAQSVADIFIKKYNVPSNNIFTEAVSDTKPLFKENMPAGTKANQRTEIFLIY